MTPGCSNPIWTMGSVIAVESTATTDFAGLFLLLLLFAGLWGKDTRFEAWIHPLMPKKQNPPPEMSVIEKTGYIVKILI